MRRARRFLGFAGLAGLALVAAHPAFAQAHNPFGVGISEGGGQAGGLTGWLLAEQAMFERQLSAAIRATKADSRGLWTLIGLSFAYGVFHAAGPGHGKAVMASYLFANERALRRGLVLTLLAALLQGTVAVLLVGLMALVFHATAIGLKAGASLVESLSYAGVALLGAWLVWRKGRAFWAALRASRAPSVARLAFRPAGFATAGPAPLALATPAYALGCDCMPQSELRAQPAHGPDCGHFHAPDPALLGDGFVWREAALTVAAAGARPCSGAILVLVFALAQGLFPVGIAAVAAMALGTALTTGALASLAVLAKGAARHLVQADSSRGILILRGLETAAAAVVLVVGVSLVLGYAALGGA